MAERSLSRGALFLVAALVLPCVASFAASCAGDDPGRMVGHSVDDLVRAYGEGARFDARPFDSSMERYGYVEGVSVLWFYADVESREVVAWLRIQALAGFPDPDSLIGLDERALVGRIGLPSYVIEREGSKTLLYNIARREGPFGRFALEGTTRVVYMEGGKVKMAR